MHDQTLRRYFDVSRQPAGSAFHTSQVSISFGEVIDAAALRAAWETVARAHVALQTRFQDTGALEERKENVLGWQELDWQASPPDDLGAAWQALVESDAATPIAVAAEPLVRVTFIRLPNGGGHALWSFHAALLDNDSVSAVSTNGSSPTTRCAPAGKRLASNPPSRRSPPRRTTRGSLPSRASCRRARCSRWPLPERPGFTRGASLDLAYLRASGTRGVHRRGESHERRFARARRRGMGVRPFPRDDLARRAPARAVSRERGHRAAGNLRRPSLRGGSLPDERRPRARLRRGTAAAARRPRRARAGAGAFRAGRRSRDRVRLSRAHAQRTACCSRCRAGWPPTCSFSRKRPRQLRCVSSRPTAPRSRSTTIPASFPTPPRGCSSRVFAERSPRSPRTRRSR